MGPGQGSTGRTEDRDRGQEQEQENQKTRVWEQKLMRQGKAGWGGAKNAAGGRRPAGKRIQETIMSIPVLLSLPP